MNEPCNIMLIALLHRHLARESELQKSDGILNLLASCRQQLGAVGCAQMRNIRTSRYVSAALIIGIAIVVVVYAIGVPSQRMGMALRATARWSFLWFSLATCGGALTMLFGPIFHALARRRRELGLAFAASHLVHIAMVVWLLYVSPDPFPRLPLILFSIGVFWVYTLALLSLSSSLTARLGPHLKIVRTIGVEYIAFAYVFEFAGRILDGNRANAIHYFPLFAAALAGPVMRICASIKRRSNPSTTAPALAG